MNDNRIQINKNIASPIITGRVTGDIRGGYVAASNERQPDYTKTAQEIDELLEHLDKQYSPQIASEKMMVVAKAMEHIEKNTGIRQRIVSALRAGGVSALAQLLSHPLSSFLIAALDDWEKTRSR